MGAGNRFLNYARDINRKVGTTLTTEKAKKIRKNFIFWGIILTIVGGIGIIFGMYKMFSGAFDDSFDLMNDDKNCPEMGEEGWFECESDNSAANAKFSGMAKTAFAGFGILAIAGIVLSVGIFLLQAGLAIVIAGEGAKFLDTAPKCPKCGDSVEENEIYCNKCGADLRNKVKCSSCGTQNEIEDKFCRNCGNKLN